MEHKEINFDRKARVLYLPGYALGALAIVSEGKDSLAYVDVLALKLKPGTIPVPSDMAETQKSGIIRPTSRESMWLLNPRDAYVELEKELIA